MKKTKILTSMFGTLILLGGLVSCGGSGEGSSQSEIGGVSSQTGSTSQAESNSESGKTSASASTSTSQKSVSLNFWHVSGQTVVDELNRDIEKFTKLVKSNDGVDLTINLEYQGGYSDQLSKITNGFATGNYPTLAIAYPDHVAEYLNAEGSNHGKYVQNLNEFIDDDKLGFGKEAWIGDQGKEDFVPAFYEEGSQYAVDGTYSLPLMKSSEVMFYNKGLVKEYAKMYDSTLTTSSKVENFMNNLTWSQFMDFCQVIKTNMSSASPISNTLQVPAFYDSDSNLFITQLYQNEVPFLSYSDTGAGQVDFNNASAKTLVTQLQDSYNKGLITTKGVENLYGSTFFKEEKTVFDIGSSGGAGYQSPAGGSFEVGVCRVPDANDNPLYVSQGLTCTILKTPNDTDGLKAQYAWKFLKYLTSTDVNTSLCITGSEGYVPVRESSYSTEDFQTFVEEGEYLGQVADIMHTQINGRYYNTPCFKGSAKAREEVGGIITQVFLNKKTVDKAFADAENNTKLAM